MPSPNDDDAIKDWVQANAGDYTSVGDFKRRTSWASSIRTEIAVSFFIETLGFEEKRVRHGSGNLGFLKRDSLGRFVKWLFSDN